MSSVLDKFFEDVFESSKIEKEGEEDENVFLQRDES